MLIVIVFTKLKHMTSLHCECFRRKKLERGDYERGGNGSCLCQRLAGAGDAERQRQGLSVRADEGEPLQLRAHHLRSRQGRPRGVSALGTPPWRLQVHGGRRLGPRAALGSGELAPGPPLLGLPRSVGGTCLRHADLRCVSLGGLHSRDTSVTL